VYANWTSRLPRLQQMYGMDNGETGFVLTALALGALVAMPLAGYLIVKNGSRVLTIVFTLVFICSVPIIAFLPDYWWLLCVMPLLGISTGVMDVAMNAQAVEVERLWGTPITSSFHACFSGGMFLGAGAAAGFISLGYDLGAHLLAVLAITLGVAAFSLRNLLPDAPEEQDEQGSAVGSKFTLGIVVLGVAALCTMIGEGAMADWTPLYMTRVTGAAEALAPLGQAAFSGAMFLGRALGDALRARFGSLWVVRGGGLLAFAGVTAAILFPAPAVAIAGFGAVGLGLANIIPVVFSEASKLPGLRPGVGISSVSTIGYAAFLFGPPIIGFVADYQNAALPAGLPLLAGVAGLRVGLGVVALLMVMLCGIAFFVLRIREERIGG
jgi:MFS family permease